MDLTFQILSLEKRLLQVIRSSCPDGSMLYEALFFDSEAWEGLHSTLCSFSKELEADNHPQNQPNEGQKAILKELLEVAKKHLTKVRSS